MARAQVDASEVFQYAAHLRSAMDRVEPAASRVVERGANNVKRNSRQAIRGHVRGRYLKHYPRSIGYDMIEPTVAEIGPDASMPQGGMGPGIEYGSSNTAPMPHLIRSAEDEMPNLEKWLDQVVTRGLR